VRRGLVVRHHNVVDQKSGAVVDWKTAVRTAATPGCKPFLGKVVAVEGDFHSVPSGCVRQAQAAQLLGNPDTTSVNADERRS